MAERFTDGRVPDPGVRALFAKQSRWQCWLDVEAALAVAEAQCGVIPAAAAEVIGSAARPSVPVYLALTPVIKPGERPFLLVPSPAQAVR